MGVWVATIDVALGATGFVALGLPAEFGTAWRFPGFGVFLAMTFGTIGLLISVRVPGN